jgi:hypothetical protein
MNNEKQLYDICLKMIKDKHQLNEYSIDKFNTFYYQVFNNSTDTDNINTLNKTVLKKINEDIILNTPKNDTIQNKIIELQNIRAKMNNTSANDANYVNNTNHINNATAINDANDINDTNNGNDANDFKLQSTNIKYIKVDNSANNTGRSFIINTIKNNLYINNKYTNYKIYPSHLCIPTAIKKLTPYIIIGIMDEHSNITYTFIPDIIGDIWDIWKPVNNNYININISSSQWKISLYDHTNNYIDLKNYYINILEIIEINNSYKIKVSNPNLFNTNDKVKIILNNNISIDNTIINKDESNNIFIFINNLKIDQFINSKIYNLNYQLSIIFNIFPT